MRRNTEYPYVQPSAIATSSSTGPQPTQSGIISSCDSCAVIADRYGTFTTDDFISWHAAVQKDCSKLFVGYQYCVGVLGTPTVRTTSTATATASTGPSPTQAGIVASCTKYYQAVSGDSCAIIASRYGTFTTDQFYEWNTAVKPDCSGLWLGYYYCIAVPGTPTAPLTTASPSPTTNGPQPQQAGLAKECKKFYKVVSGDSCYNIEQQYGISADQFNSWNPDVQSDCSKLYAGYYVCVGV